MTSTSSKKISKDASTISKKTPTRRQQSKSRLALVGRRLHAHSQRLELNQPMSTWWTLRSRKFWRTADHECGEVPVRATLASHLHSKGCKALYCKILQAFIRYYTKGKRALNHFPVERNERQSRRTMPA